MSDKYIMYDPADFDKIEIKPAENSDEIARLRADLASVTAERDRMREALEPLAAITLWTDKYPDGPLSVDDNKRYVDPQWIVRARAALEGVTEPASPWRDIESAPKDGTPILCVKKGGGFQPEILHFEDGVFGWLTDDMGFGCHPNRQPTHWMPLPEPPR